MSRKTTPAETRFWRFVEKTDTCWLWTGYKKADGYGVFTDSPKHTTLAHRFSYVLQNGNIPTNHVVRHKCDVRNCVNPDHLETGTQMENIHDMLARGRGPLRTGIYNSNAKLTENDLVLIPQLKSQGMSSAAIAKQLNVSPSTIRKVLKCGMKT